MLKIYIILITFTLSFVFSFSEEIVIPKRPINKPLLRQNDFILKRFGNDFQDFSLRQQALNQSNTLEKISKKYYDMLQSEIPLWKNIGPNDIGGRVRSIAVHPEDPNIVYIGAAAGGIWKTTNGGQSWLPIFDFENASSFGSLAIDPNNPDIIYSATGEMIIGGGIPYLGNGVYKSTDAGSSWFQVGLTQVAAFSKIYVHPLNSNIIYAAGVIRNEGIYKSNDGAKTWEKIFTGNITDLSINPLDINEIFAGLNTKGMIYSNDGGKNWEERSNGLESIGGRISVQAFAKDSKILYALIERKDSRGAIFKSTNKGLNWILTYSGSQSFFNSQGYYNNFITIHPDKPEIVLAGGIELWLTVNGGQNWNVMNKRTSPNEMHVDQHHAVFAPSNNKIVYVANDGGMYKSTDTGYNWFQINTGLKITQFYSLALDNKKVSRNFGGTQDNGTVGNPSDKWKMVVGGDGFDCFLHPNDPNILFGEIYYGEIFRYNVKSNEYKFLTNGLSNQDRGIWHSPFIFDEKTHTMYLGKKAIYASYNYGDFFFKLTTEQAHEFTSIAISPKNPRIIYAGNRIGQIMFTDNGGTSWNYINTSDLAGKYITDIKTSPKYDSVVYVTFSGYGNHHIYKSTNFGNSWLAIDFSLPDVPVNCIEFHPENESTIFAATDIGVFATFNAGNDWFEFGDGLPRTPVTDLRFHTNRIILPALTLRAATHGRSVWEIEIPNETFTSPMVVSPSGGEYYIGNSLVDFSWYGLNYPVKVEISEGQNSGWILLKDSIFTNHSIIKLPDFNTFSARIKVSSLNSGLSATSRTFSITPEFKGAILAQFSLGFNSYGIKYIDGNEMYVVNYNSRSIHKYNASDFSLIKKISIPVEGFFTDITCNQRCDSIFIHKMSDETGKGAEILILDTLGNLLNRINSPAQYPMGLAYHQGLIYSSERDGEQRIFRFYPDNDFHYEIIGNNPIREQFAPRCFTFYNDLFHQVNTFFSSNVLTNSEISVFNLQTSEILSKVPLVEQTGKMNARGIDIDSKDNNYWVSNFTGTLFKISTRNLSTNIEDINTNSALIIFPNPASNYISFGISGKNNGISSISIINSIGEEVINDKINNSELKEFDISKLPTGVYFVILNSNYKNPIYQRFIKY